MKRIIVGNILSRANIEVGEGLTTKINLIVGTNNTDGIELEKRKIQAASELGVHTIIDLSIMRVHPPLWKYGQEKFPHIAFGKVAPIFVAMENSGTIDPKNLWKEIEWSVLAGVDYMTFNLIPLKFQDLGILKTRNFPTTSRQGGLILNHMIRHNADNPYLPILDDILALCKKYRVTIHIGSTFRPKGITEAYDKAHRWELREQMAMFRRFNEAGTQAIVEPMSHQPLKDIGPGVDALRKDFGEYVPFQMLGPIVTEVNFNCDQYAAAAGAAIAAMHNVGKITTIPPREHVGFPTLENTIEGIKAAKTSAHAGDLCRLPELLDDDRRILENREKAQSCDPNSKDTGCDKCLDLCPFIIQKALKMEGFS